MHTGLHLYCSHGFLALRLDKVEVAGRCMIYKGVIYLRLLNLPNMRLQADISDRFHKASVCEDEQIGDQPKAPRGTEIHQTKTHYKATVQ